LIIEDSVSPKINRLRTEIQNGKKDAINNFWEEVLIHGTPLIETIEGDNYNLLVTFIWRQETKIDNVYVFGSFPSWECSTSKLKKLLDTNIWYRTYKVKKGISSLYFFSVNDNFGDDWVLRKSNWQPDPLNKKTFIFPKDDENPSSKEITASVVELYGSVAPTYNQRKENIPKGNVEIHRYNSKILNNERRVWIYTPNGFSKDKHPYNLLFLFDGRHYIDVIPTPIILDNLIAEEKIRPTIAVTIDSTNRTLELPFNDSFVQFLVNELIPWIRNSYNVTTDPQNVIIGGSSLGGLAAFLVGVKHPEIFGNILSQSGSLFGKPQNYDGHIPWLQKHFESVERLPLKIYMNHGILDSKNIITANRSLQRILDKKGYSVSYSEFYGGHDYLCWSNTLGEGILKLFEEV
jgi:enterochelin esterase-like enzyme